MNIILNNSKNFESIENYEIISKICSEILLIIDKKLKQSEKIEITEDDKLLMSEVCKCMR